MDVVVRLAISHATLPSGTPGRPQTRWPGSSARFSTNWFAQACRQRHEILSAVDAEVEIELRDGAKLIVRPVRPADKEAIRKAFRRLSPETRYRRFLSITEELSDQQLRYLTELDHHEHEALIAYDPETGYGIAVARFVRLPDDPAVAEAAVVIGDSWQGRGLGTALSALLAERGREEGVERFDATLLAGNERMIHVLNSLGPAWVLSRDGPTITVEVDISTRR